MNDHFLVVNGLFFAKGRTISRHGVRAYDDLIAGNSPICRFIYTIKSITDVYIAIKGHLCYFALCHELKLSRSSCI
jgi:hypothetical protein